MFYTDMTVNNPLNSTFKAFGVNGLPNLQSSAVKRQDPYIKEQQDIYSKKQEDLKEITKKQKCIRKICLAMPAIAIVTSVAFVAAARIPCRNLDKLKNLCNKMVKQYGLDKKGFKYTIADKNVPFSLSHKGKDITKECYKAAKAGGFSYHINQAFAWQETPLTITHEIGHGVSGNMKYGAKWIKLCKKLPYLSGAVGLYGLVNIHDEKMKKKTPKPLHNFIKKMNDNAGVIAFATFAPLLTEEFLASFRALKFLYKNDKELFKKSAIVLTPAFGTYLVQASAVAAFVSLIKTSLDRFYLKKSMYDQSQEFKKYLKFDDSVSPKIAVIDDYSKNTIKIDSDKIADISHGKVVESFIKSGLPNAQITQMSTTVDESSVKNALEYILNGQEKYDAINLSKSSDITFQDLSKFIGLKVTAKNVLQNKDEIKKRLFASSHKDAEYIKDIVNSLEKLSRDGTKIYIAAGNKGNKNFNLYALADGANIVGATKKYGEIAPFSASNMLVNRYERGSFRIKKAKDDNGQDGFDITQNHKPDILASETTSKRKKPTLFDLNGTSFATPQALVKDFRKILN